VTDDPSDAWLFTEGAVGMENQCVGLAERLGLRYSAYRVTVNPPWRWIAPHFVGNPFLHLKAGSDRPIPPWPKLVIGCGRQSVPYTVIVRQMSQGATAAVQIQSPRLPLNLFDLIFAPEHDGLTGVNVLPVLGSLGRVSKQSLTKARDHFAPLLSTVRAPRLAVLIGGPSKSHRFGLTEAENIGRTLRHLARGHGLMITLSRRSGPDIRSAILNQMGPTDAYVWDDTGENPYLGLLAWADAVLATADSVNMVCEAGVTGKPVHVLELPGGTAKFTRFFDGLMARGVARPFRGTIEDWTYEPLDETGRAAEAVRQLLAKRGTPLPSP
jgi:mitochondrial fission protein ELM1